MFSNNFDKQNNYFTAIRDGASMEDIFKERVLAIVKTIQPGATLSYKQVAELAGSPRAYRAVGMLMKHNNNPKVPCHRVIRSDGTLGGYNNGGTDAKKNLLEKEKAERKNYL